MSDVDSVTVTVRCLDCGAALGTRDDAAAAEDRERFVVDHARRCGGSLTTELDLTRI